jgi:excisionase family DNA binding protein
MTANSRKYFTSVEAASLLMVSAVTIREWARKGLLPSVSTAGGHRRFLLDSLQQFAHAHGIRLEVDQFDVAAGPLRILLVDDDPRFVEYLREIVLGADAGVRVECATDGFHAGQLTETLRPQLVVLDINMPRLNGIELCRRLRASPATAAARLVILSGALSSEYIAEAQAAGADAWLEKGASAAEILRAMQLSERVARSQR